MRACASRSPSAAAAGACCRRPRSSCATRSGSPSAWSPAASPTSCSCSRAIFPVTATAGGEDSEHAHARASLTAAAETEIDGLRPHREGAPASRIHWPAYARGAGLMERKLISEADSRPLVVLDPRAPESPEALDAAVRAAASLTVHFAKRGGCGLLMPGDRRAHVIERDLLAWPQSHVRLALVEEHTGPALMAAQNRRGLIAYVSARTVDRVPRGLGRTPGGCLLVIPGALPNRRAVVEVAGCRGYVGARTGSAALMATVGRGGAGDEPRGEAVA